MNFLMVTIDMFIKRESTADKDLRRAINEIVDKFIELSKDNTKQTTLKLINVNDKTKNVKWTNGQALSKFYNEKSATTIKDEMLTALITCIKKED